MRVVLFGKNGQVGHELQRTLPPLGEIVALDQQDADLTDLEDLRTLLYAQAPSVIVNAAAYTAVDKAESEPALAKTINADAVKVMADYARYNGSLLVHYSADYIFDGDKTDAYLENDDAHPLNVYGQTKLAGEEAIQQAGCHHLIFRTSWVYSSHGHNFVKTVLRLAAERDRLDVVADQIGAPTSAELVADVTALAIASWMAGVFPEGIYHLTASGETSRYKFACYIVDQAIAKGAKLKLTTSRIRAVTTEEYPLPAKRPKNSRLDNNKLTARLGFQMPDWKAHVGRALDQIMMTKQK